jgi:hypothetical protein
VKGFVLRNLTPPLFVHIRLLWMQQKSPETEIQAAELYTEYYVSSTYFDKILMRMLSCFATSIAGRMKQ